MTKTAITPTREEDFAQWYQQVIQAADLAENAPVRGCMVIKPYGYAIWENIQKIFDLKLKKLEVQNAYFPLLIPLNFLSQEAEHIDGFAKECAVVTHHRLKKDSNGHLVPDGELTEPYIIRPTSEAIIGHMISGWIQSYRDLPLKLNQWCNVMRWEMRPRLFLRTSEFLWQEGHTVFATADDSKEDAVRMHKVYHEFITGELSMDAIPGMKSAEERFPGASETYTIEVMTQDGKALQAATSHNLGQSFSTAFGIKFLDKDGQEKIAHTASWGLSTRLIGAIIMNHSDDDGLMLPPQIAPYQVVIIPIIKDDSKLHEILLYINDIEAILSAKGIRYHLDLSDMTSGNKAWKWIKKGAPIRIEVGMMEREAKNLTVARRDISKDNKSVLSIDELPHTISGILEDIESNMRNRSLENREKNTRFAENLKELEQLFADGFQGFVVIKKFYTDSEEFFEIGKQYSLTRRCVLENFLPQIKEECVIIARSY